MTTFGILQIVLYTLVIAALTKPLGAHMARVFQGQRTFLHPLLRPLERLCYAIGGVDEKTEQRWTQYAGSILSFSLVSFVALYAMERLQGLLPFNPMKFGAATPPNGATAMTPDL